MRRARAAESMKRPMDMRSMATHAQEVENVLVLQVEAVGCPQHLLRRDGARSETRTGRRRQESQHTRDTRRPTSIRPSKKGPMTSKHCCDTDAIAMHTVWRTGLTCVWEKGGVSKRKGTRRKRHTKPGSRSRTVTLCIMNWKAVFRCSGALFRSHSDKSPSDLAVDPRHAGGQARGEIQRKHASRQDRNKRDLAKPCVAATAPHEPPPLDTTHQSAAHTFFSTADELPQGVLEGQKVSRGLAIGHVSQTRPAHSRLKNCSKGPGSSLSDCKLAATARIRKKAASCACGWLARRRERWSGLLRSLLGENERKGKSRAKGSKRPVAVPLTCHWG